MDVIDVEEPQAPLLTPAEYGAYLRRLEDLREIRDRDLPELMRDARSFVASDAAEEVVQIQEDFAVVDGRIARLEELIRTARVVHAGPADVVCPGRTVEVEYLRTATVTSYRVAGTPPTSDIGTASAASPMGRAIIGRCAGDLVTVRLPAGRVEQLRILAVRRGVDPG
jgi:transcription elongation factor GreA